MKNQLFGIAPISPAVIGLVSAALLVIALIASVIPAWRASAIDPIIVLSR
jgi:ABC-type lipoprotein release transport system permease subunit